MAEKLKNEIDGINELPVEDIDDIDEYLKVEYSVIYEPEYLKDTSQILNYFKNCWDEHDLFDCGQGYYTDKETVKIKILDKYYSVTINAEIGSSKQDRGDRGYWVENIEDVNFKEIEKPRKKERIIVTYKFDIAIGEEKYLEDKFNGFEYKRIN